MTLQRVNRVSGPNVGQVGGNVGNPVKEARTVRGETREAGGRRSSVGLRRRLGSITVSKLCGGGSAPCRLRLDLTGQQRVDSVQPVVQVTVAGGLYQESTLRAHNTETDENQGMDRTCSFGRISGCQTKQNKPGCRISCLSYLTRNSTNIEKD